MYIEGSLRTDSWDDKQTGQKRYQTYINASDLVLLGGGGGGVSREGGDEGGFTRSKPAAPRAETWINADPTTPSHPPRSPTTIYRSSYI